MARQRVTFGISSGAAPLPALASGFFQSGWSPPSQLLSGSLFTDMLGSGQFGTYLGSGQFSTYPAMRSQTYSGPEPFYCDHCGREVPWDQNHHNTDRTKRYCYECAGFSDEEGFCKIEDLLYEAAGFKRDASPLILADWCAEYNRPLAEQWLRARYQHVKGSQ